MKDSEVLKKARNRVKRAGGAGCFICWAIRDVRGADYVQVNRLRNWIDRLLVGHATYESWLASLHTETWRKMSCADTKAGRLAWLDWMIAYCEAEEAKETACAPA